MKRLLAFLALAVLAVSAVQALGRRPPNLFPDLPQSKVGIVTGTGTHEFQVWIAADDRSRQRGLMHVRGLPADHGMLFLFETSNILSFWMKDTWLSLDLIFIGADGVIVNIVQNARPMSLDPIFSAAPAKAVLELVAGSSERIGLAAGDRIVLPALTPQAQSGHRPAS